jgi:glutathione synthase/RimK-type ligase-like ATP-grasp enzyme
MSPSDFFQKTSFENNKLSRAVKIINLCNTFDYLSKGYYVSLLAEARGMQVVPPISTIITLNWKRHYEFYYPEINLLLSKYFKDPIEDPLTKTYTTYFGRHDNEQLDPITRRLFDIFRFPIITFQISCRENNEWKICKIYSGSLQKTTAISHSQFHSALRKFTGSAWNINMKNKNPERYWLAILHDPTEPHPPSNKAALNKFIRVGKKLGIWIELITKKNFASLLEFDALFIRASSAINNYTLRFALKADQEGIPCIDDTQSIVRCCNKVFLMEILKTNGIPIPHSVIIDRKSKLLDDYDLAFPFVAKIPDGSFSHGIYKIENTTMLSEIIPPLLKRSEIVILQEFLPSAFDWRVGVLNGEALFVNKYFMAKDHWQIYNHASKSKKNSVGHHESIPIHEAPSDILTIAIDSAKLMGKGLYGVDLKQTKDGKIYVIEVNDNPNIDSGVEDLTLGDELYTKILMHFISLIEDNT